MEQTLYSKPSGRQHNQNKQDLSKYLLQNPGAITTETMGREFRTPSPAREGYISSSNVNSPSSASQFYNNKQGGELLGCEENTYSQESERINSFFLEDKADEASEMEAPATPTKKRALMPWHGLLSPQTPSFAKYSPQIPSACSRDDATGSNTHELLNDTEVSETALQDVFASANKSPGKGIKHATPEHMQLAIRGPQQATPDSHSAYSDAGATAEKPKNGDASHVIGDNVEHDVTLARELEKSPSPTRKRRSARLRTKPKLEYIFEPSITGPRPARKPCVDEEPPAQPELTIVPCKSDPIPFEGLPAVQSTSWQLQYPPGGSTHPSYPYPPVDPRLIFHQPFVPVVDGLPDIIRVPKLVLPMNWRHVSWAGLLPIVFDPYHQAFKLTPVGPLPLTCEELRQGGLHKYVPGGELHPEHGMLPDMLKLSDGSDAEVFDFDGIDWTLPWEGQLDFHAPSALGTESNNWSNGIVGPGTSNVFNFEANHPWREARDCPNMIIDLADAWRWLSAKETDPTADFVPTPGKTRHGTGAVRLVRKLKSPIPELMMFVLQAEEPVSLSSTSILPNYILPNQDQSTKGKALNAFCPFKSVATPTSVDITLLGDTEFTIMELLCFFPQHYYWGHAADRLFRAGVPPSFIRNMICMTRALNDETGPKSSTISSVTAGARKRDVAGDEATEEVEVIDLTMGTLPPPPAPTALYKADTVKGAAGYTAEGWTYDVCEKIDYPLLALAHGLQSLPSGVDAGPLTALILWCRENGRYRVLLSDVLAMLKEAGIEPLIEPGEGECPDKEVVGRYAEVLGKERQKARKGADAVKRAVEESGGRWAKRRKTE